jgi:hypothetical protein
LPLYWHFLHRITPLHFNIFYIKKSWKFQLSIFTIVRRVEKEGERTAREKEESGERERNGRGVGEQRQNYLL